ncbi:branched-subunit amino acid transport protein AzlD [Hypnocyclicus thermotrophus]|uniref:Branched-subunit amino acid transport protein AzlD n=1 Tax=Hypnocyclicus thermotrophus TaxID=1627895 RepID=A0AA46I658_9FUSO|nr:AzlD domain-containing protein [Hypnocyclicus thermotrophus]TDT72027.1 branched-subunit amino acid transport protein AzlD [Hypnocyclicus thermotrophus]
MNIKFLIIIITGAIINILLRAVPMLIPNIKNNKYIESFLGYVPYTALAALLIPDVFSSGKNVLSIIIALIIASIMILKKQNNLIIVFLTIFIVFLFNNYI